jgi:murein DD-endopeptidase MepM/ murein hydrolase activator NlpD
VRVAENNRPDNKVGGGKQPCCTTKDPTWFAGNYIVIDHENGECTLLAHLRQGSQSVAEGDRVTRGQRIGEVGLSGDSFTVPHLHYQLMDSCNFTDAEGLPSRFSAFERLSGPNDGQEVKAYVGAGEVVLVRPYFKR